MPPQSDRVLFTPPLGSSRTTPQPAPAQPPRVQTSVHRQSAPEASRPATAAAAATQERVNRPLDGASDDLVDHDMVNRLLALQPNMTLPQMTAVLDILHPDRHRNAATAAVRRSSTPDQSLPPPVVPVSTAPPSTRPLTGTQISNPQRRLPVPSHRSGPESILQILNGPSRKR